MRLPGGPVVKTSLREALPMQGAQAESLVRDLDPTCCNEKLTCHS